MATHKQYYITCDDCGKILEDENGVVVAEESDSIRSEAMDFQWPCYLGDDEDADYCKQCFA